jgi:hypothetical protein
MRFSTRSHALVGIVNELPHSAQFHTIASAVDFEDVIAAA